MEMETLPEVVIASGASTSVFDASNGNILASYKMNDVGVKTLSLVGEDYLIGGLINEPRLRVTTVPIMKNPESATFACPGVVNALAVSSCGTYCIAGIKEDIYLWRVSSGELLNVLSRHYQDVSCIKFSSDDSQFLSGGKDGHVIIWILSQAIAVDKERDQVKPRYAWNHHSSEITDIFTGALGFVSRVATTSLDMMCKIYELDSGILLTTIYLDVPLTSVVMDIMEYHVLLGATNGCIYKINTYESLPKEIHFNDTQKIRFKAHELKVNCLSISLDGRKLLSASDDKTCRLWDIASMACLLSLPMEGVVTNAFLAVKPATLSSEDLKPQFVISTFKREFDNSTDNGCRKLIDSSPISRLPTLENILHSDEAYNLEAIPTQVKLGIKSLNPQDEKYFENVFQQSLNGNIVNELKELNNQLYSQLVERGMEYLPEEMQE